MGMEPAAHWYNHMHWPYYECYSWDFPAMRWSPQRPSEGQLLHRPAVAAPPEKRNRLSGGVVTYTGPPIGTPEENDTHILEFIHAV